MNRPLIFTLVAIVPGSTVSGGAEPSFSKSIRAEDYAAAGLNKLVRDYKGGAAVAPSAGAQKDSAASAEPAKVVLKPGTKVEYSAVESRIAGEFRGWEPRTMFTLENGQRWQVVGESHYSGANLESPVVKIAPGALGSWWMTIEGVKQRVKVAPLGAR